VKEFRKIIAFTIASTNKIPKKKLNKESKDLYNENYKPLKKEIKEAREDGKIFHAHGLAESIL
jgi:hypothetical protein